jgi:hypothetical protein
MLLWIVQIATISVVLIFLIHHLLHFFKSMLTVPKIKDLVNTSAQKYENIYNIINQQNSNTNSPNNSPNNSNTNSPNTNSSTEYTLIDLLPKSEEGLLMKNELKNFLKKQLHTSDVYELSANNFSFL